jgi:TRAP-type C4-dicarboxylate transport system substrate-binding protein
LICSGVARADAPVVRVATIIPDGTGWARELRALARDVETSTSGALRVKWIFGGVAGDEMAMAERIARDQLDGTVSGGRLCEKLAPSMAVVRIPGLFQSRSEITHVMSRLKPKLDREFLEAGFANLAEAAAGASIPFGRHPVHDLAELKKERIWIWDIDEPLAKLLPAMGLSVVPTPIYEAGRAYDANKLDVFLTPAQAALAFQWSAQARWYSDFQFGWIVGCFLIANRSFDRLPLAAREALRASSAKTQKRMEDVGSTMDEQLLGGLFAKQGLQPVQVSQAARAELFEAARTARDKAHVVPDALLQQVMAWLADFRAQH